MLWLKLSVFLVCAWKSIFHSIILDSSQFFLNIYCDLSWPEYHVVTAGLGCHVAAGVLVHVRLLVQRLQDLLLLQLGLPQGALSQQPLQHLAGISRHLNADPPAPERVTVSHLVRDRGAFALFLTSFKSFELENLCMHRASREFYRNISGLWHLRPLELLR